MAGRQRMNRRLLISVALGLAVLALLVGLALRSQRVLQLGLPPKVVAADDKAAWSRAIEYAAVNGGAVFSIAGTGSMAPFIPAAPAGRDPVSTVVAFGVTKRGANFADVTPGAVCLYAHSASAVGVSMHGAAMRDGPSWIMSGLHNARSDIRMTRETFRGLVACVFTWPQ